MTDVNLTSLVVSALNPTSTWKGLIVNNFVSNAFSISAQSGKYNGIGVSKDLETVLLQTTLSTLAGKATSGLDIGINKLQIRLNHVNTIQGNGSYLSTSLQNIIRNYQARAAAVSTVTGIPSEAINNTLEKDN